MFKTSQRAAADHRPPNTFDVSSLNQDKLQKEEKNTAVNLLKLNEGWRSILRQTRAAELQKDVTVLSQTFDRQLDALVSITKVNRPPAARRAAR